MSAILLLILLLAEEAPKAPAAAPAAPEKPAAEKPASPPAPASEIPWARDLETARADAAKAGRRILAVVLEEWYPSEPCRRLEESLRDPAARAALADLVPLRVVEGEKREFSEPRGLADLGHPYAALLDADGSVVATLRGARAPAAFAVEVRRLAAAADRWQARKAEAGKAPGDPKALFALSEALRDLGRTAEGDDVLARAEKADPEGRSGLVPLFRYRRLEARVEDRFAVQDFEGARALLDAYDREFPNSPRRRWVALHRAAAQAYAGQADAALETLRDLAQDAKDADLAALAADRAARLEKIQAEKPKK